MKFEGESVIILQMFGEAMPNYGNEIFSPTGKGFYVRDYFPLHFVSHLVKTAQTGPFVIECEKKRRANWRENGSGQKNCRDRCEVGNRSSPH